MTIGEDDVVVSAGDYAALPVSRRLAHKLVNTGDSDLVYLCLSTNHMPEITVERTRLLHMGEVALDLFAAERGPAASGTFLYLNLYSLEYFFIFFGMQIKRIVKPCRISQARRFPNVQPGCPMSAGFSEHA